jgi:hypothetical protein
MPGIFISYRRKDSIAWAGRLHDSLERLFPGVEIFMDIEAIPPGIRFAPYIRERVGACGVLLVLIGPQWLVTAGPEGNRRIDDPDDFVSLEIKAALDREVRIIPMLVGGASIPPRGELPESLKPLCDFQGFVISDHSWQDDCARLARHIREIVQPAPPAPAQRRRPSAAIAAIAAIALFAAAYVLWKQIQPPRQPPAPPTPSPPTYSTPPPQPPSPATPASPQVPATPPADQPETPKPPAFASLLDLGLEGRWELTALETEKGSQSRPIQVDLKRAGKDLQITSPDFKETFLLAITAEQISLTGEKPSHSKILFTARREPESEPGNWVVSISEKKGAGTPKTVGLGRLTVSEDWHVWVAEFIDTDSPGPAFKLRLNLAIAPGETLARFSFEISENLGKRQLTRGMLRKQ